MCFSVLCFSKISSQDTLSLHVSGICDMCKDRIEGISLNTIGVGEASYTLKDQSLILIYEKAIFNLKELENQLSLAGHDTETQTATNEAYESLPLCCRYRNPTTTEHAIATSDALVKEIWVNGSCEICKERIEEVAKKQVGISEASWDVETKLLKIVTNESFNLVKLEAELIAVGHDTRNQNALIKDYNKLPQCCQYRENNLNGLIWEIDVKGKKLPLIGATVNWLDGSNGTTTDETGGFSLPMSPTSDSLAVSYLGYRPDTIYIPKKGHIEIVMEEHSQLLKEVQIKYRKKSVEVSYLNPIKVKQISKKELTKAACCNLSESFSTNPSIDVSFTDAVTGTKQIEMLGLAGPYVQITRENMPDIRGLSAIYGLTYIPGPWIESIQMNLGTGSAINGFESIAGQLNVELKKPGDNEYLHLNGYASQGRYEANAIVNTALDKKWTTNLLTHYNFRNSVHDRNFDGFTDMPTGKTAIVSNNYAFQGENGNEAQIGWKYSYTDQTAGQDPHLHENIEHPPGYELWQATLHSDRFEAYLKRGKVFTKRPYSSIGFQFSAMYHNQKSLFGKRPYDSNQKMIYGNLIYQTIIHDTDHKLTMGSSIIAEKFNELVINSMYNRAETVPGVFAEYAYSLEEKFNLVVGMRADHHNNHGLFFTPRVHTRYALNTNTILRASIGRGQRTANIFAENIGIFASSREILVHSNSSTKPYGLDAESAWNFGVNITRDFPNFMKGASWSLDLYHTLFNNQIVVDYDSDVRSVSFYNLAGKSFSSSIQTQLDFNPIDRFDIRLAYRYNNVKTTYGNVLLAKPLTSPHRAFINLAYETQNKLKFDFTLNWQSSKRLPTTMNNPEQYQFEERSPSFFMADAQASKSFGDVFELYLGAENIFNLRQKNAIIASGEPYSKYFDSTLIWGPVFGRNYYIGFRYKLFREDQ